jgi:3-hydroxyacyl-CoA dehydrogenase/enoyl-CoA hydratase/3-hydroxybutyryl-CoA epimerase
MEIYRILKCTEIYYGAACHIDKALEIEARYFVDTLFSKETKTLFGLFIFINDARGKSKPKAMTESFKKVGVIGAGMMGAGLLM